MVPQIFGHKILWLKNNFIPNGLVSLEQFFDKNGVAIKPVIYTVTKAVEEVNIGTHANPKNIYISLNNYQLNKNLGALFFLTNTLMFSPRSMSI